MSAQEIMAELPKLSHPELEMLDARLHALLCRTEGGATAASWGGALLQLAGSVEGLPADFSENHDHYLHGAPRR
jgi:hypothetical protein